MNWSCRECPETGTADAGAERHTKATSHATMTTHTGVVSGWCRAPIGARPKHELCQVPGCGCLCHAEVAA